MSQSMQILNHMISKPITAIDALQQYGCFRLAARINDLRMQGHSIHTEMTVDNGKRHATYHLLNKKPLD
jgi:hypothetical protein